MTGTSPDEPDQVPVTRDGPGARILVALIGIGAVVAAVTNAKDLLHGDGGWSMWVVDVVILLVGAACLLVAGARSPAYTLDPRARVLTGKALGRTTRWDLSGPLTVSFRYRTGYRRRGSWQIVFSGSPDHPRLRSGTPSFDQVVATLSRMYADEPALAADEPTAQVLRNPALLDDRYVQESAR